MATDKQLQATFDEFHRASAILKMRLANSPHSEQTEVQRRKVQALREKLLDQVYRQLGFDVNQPSQNEDAVLNRCPAERYVARETQPCKAGPRSRGCAHREALYSLLAISNISSGA
jgi:hypothetical protein